VPRCVVDEDPITATYPPTARRVSPQSIAQDLTILGACLTIPFVASGVYVAPHKADASESVWCRPATNDDAARGHPGAAQPDGDSSDTPERSSRESGA
jgi:hypothetical protein